MTAEIFGRHFLSSTLQVAFGRVASSEILDYFRGRKLNDGLLKKLRMTLLSINQLLDDAEEKQYTNPNGKKWLDKLKDAAFKAEDLVDVIATQASRQKLDAEIQTTTTKLRDLDTAFVCPIEKEIESRIQELLDELEFLARETDVMGLKDGSGIGTGRGVGDNRPYRGPTTSFVDESSICGRYADKEEIIQILLSHDGSCNLPAVDVISIVGMEGLGKTALAQLVYNHEYVISHFHLRVWVCASGEFDVFRLTKQILQGVTLSPKDYDDLNLLQIKLKEVLMGKKFLLVLDDLWNENYSCWEIFQAPFNYGRIGSKILVTTRSKIVTSVMHSSHVHHLKPLEDEDSWFLFAKHASIDQSDDRYSSLIPIGRKIVEKCGGLPLAIKILAGLLCRQLSSEAWVNILENEVWHLPEHASNIIPALLCFDELESPARQKDVMGLKDGPGRGVGNNRPYRGPTTSLVNESCICGRHADREEIIQILLSHDGSCNLPAVDVISIVGMGGLGKTALAQLVYNHEYVISYFDLRVWVCASGEFDVFHLTKQILQGVTFSPKDYYDQNLLQIELKEMLMGKKFLLVLDDLWNENYSCWEIFQAPFNYGRIGSKILVTTRSKIVTSVIHSSHVHHLKPLEDEDSWLLFTKHASIDQSDDRYSSLIPIGRKIVEKCEGLPLAIKILAGLLCRQQLSREAWVNILENKVWHLPDHASNILPALILSYHFLPSHLKRCFAYCSIFPKDYAIEKEFLIQLWAAEGLLHSHQEGQSIKDVGNEIFKDLESRSFFEPSRQNGFIMHDLINDLAKSVMGEFGFQLKGDCPQDISLKARYFSQAITFNSKVVNFEPIFKCSHLRSFMTLNAVPFKECKLQDNQLPRLASLKYLRVLSLFGYEDVEKLLNDIDNLTLLRYLDISHTSIKELPDSICMLFNLQTLKLRGCHNLTELPSDFHKLINLQYLDLYWTRIKKMPKHMEKLKQLYMLFSYTVGKHRGSDMKELDKLNHLRGRLLILKLENAIDPMDATRSNMKDKKNLEELTLGWSRKSENSQLARNILESLQPNINLQKLNVYNYNGTKFPDWFGALHLPNLVSLELRRSDNCSSLPSLGKLPSLMQLRISGFNGVQVIGLEFYGSSSSSVPFRSLQLLRFADMRQWEEWNICFEGESFPVLRVLEISNCPKLRRSLPQHLPSLTQLHIVGCENLQATRPKASPVTQQS